MVNPNHSVLAIYGDFEPQQLLPRIRQALGPWTGDAAPLPDLPKETHPLKADRVLEKKNQKSCPSLFVGTNGLPFNDPDRPVLDVLDAVLSGSGSAGGRLFEGLRGGHEDLVYIVGATPFSGRNAGFFAVITQTTQANLDKVQGIIEDQLRKLTTELVPESELETARNAILTAYKLESESMDARARRVAFNTAMGLGVDYEAKYMAAVSRVQAEDVRRVAKELFDHLLVVRTLPEKPVEILGAPGKS
jgi:zinc protease